MKLKNVKLDMKVTLKDDWKTLSPNSIRLETITKSDFYTVTQTDEKEDITGLNVKIKNHLNEFAWVSAMALKKHKPEELKQMLSQEEKEVFEGFGYAPQPLLEAIPNAEFWYSSLPKYANPTKEDYVVFKITYGTVWIYDTKKKNLFCASMYNSNEEKNALKIVSYVLYNQKDEFDLEFAINLLRARIQGLDEEKKLRAVKFKELYLPLESNHWTQITDDLVLYNLKTKKFIQVITDSYGNIIFVQHIMQPNVNHRHEILVNRLPITQKFYISPNYVYVRFVELNFEHMFAILETCIKIG